MFGKPHLSTFQRLETQNGRLLRWALLGLCLTPIVGAFFFNWGLNLLSPEPCLFQRMFGFVSPSCGLTRSFMAIARGDWATALTYHAFGPILFVFFLFGAIHITAELIIRRPLPFAFSFITQRPLLWGAIGFLLFFGYYALRLYARYGDGRLLESVLAPQIWETVVTGSQAL